MLAAVSGTARWKIYRYIKHTNSIRGARRMAARADGVVDGTEACTMVMQAPMEVHRGTNKIV